MNLIVLALNCLTNWSTLLLQGPAAVWVDVATDLGVILGRRHTLTVFTFAPLGF